MAAELAVVLSAGRGDGVAVSFRPRSQGCERFAELTGDGGETVFDLGRHGPVHGPDEQAVAFQLAQVEGEHPAADTLDGALQLSEADGPGSGSDNDADAPLACDVVEYLADRARLLLLGLDGHSDVPLGHESAS